MDDPIQAMTPAEATALIEADKAERSKAFAAYIEAGVKQFRCDLSGVPKYTAAGQGWLTLIDVVIVAR